jgi:hypothetical protein
MHNHVNEYKSKWYNKKKPHNSYTNTYFIIENFYSTLFFFINQNYLV